MPKGKRKFLDRKKAVTFNLVHRSQRDPLIADETAPQRVLVPVNENVSSGKETGSEVPIEKRKEEQRKYGIYFDDDYNYLQHLKNTQEVTMLLQPKTPLTHKRKEKVATSEIEDIELQESIRDVTNTLTLPSSVFASEVEEDVGMLNKAGSQGLCLSLDPEVVAALDEDFDFDDPDNVLEDNFIELAMGEGSGEDSDAEEEDEQSDDGSGSGRANVSDMDSDDDCDSQSGAGGGRMPRWEGRGRGGSRLSQYSMSSSVIRRNEGLMLLDQQFDKMYEEYGDMELGALDCDEIEGYLPETDERLRRAADSLERSLRRYQLDKETERVRMRHLQEIEEESEDELETVEVEPKEKWDCETILSTYSNIYNHPKLIEEPKMGKKIRINRKTGVPSDVLGRAGRLTVGSLARFDALHAPAAGHDAGSDGHDAGTDRGSVLSTLSVLSLRPKDETPEEKKERKRLLKEYRKERRIEKKANKEAFKEEKKRQEKVMLNNIKNVQGIKIC